MADFNSKYSGEQVETMLDQIANGEVGGGGGIAVETDPTFSASPAASITTEKISAWDNKEDKPIIFDAEKAGIEAGDGSEEYPGTFTPEQFQLATGMTFAEFYEAVLAGKRVVLRFNDSTIEPEAVDVTDDSIQVSYTKYNGQLGVGLYCTTEYMMLSSGWLTNAFCEIFYTKEEIDTNKQDTLVSGTNIKTINGQSILGSGDIETSAGGDTSGLSERVDGLETTVNTLVSGNASIAIESFNEITAFLDGIEDSENLDNIIASIEQQIAGKMDEVTLATVATSGSYNDLSNKPTIPSAVTESTVSGWGFTKNTGTYSKPSTGIPKTDLDSTVQTSLGKADTALQSYTEQYKGTVTKVKINGSEKTPDADGLVDLGMIDGGGSSSGGSISYPVVEIGDTTASLEGLNPNTYYQIFGENELMSFTLTVVLNEPTDNSVANEYVFEFSVPNILHTPSLSLPDTIKWANGAAPVIQKDKTYVVSIVNNLAVFAEF